MNYTKRAELHCHSKRDRLPYAPFVYDSVQTVEEIIATAIQKQIEILAISDHDSLRGYQKAKIIVETKKLPVIVIPASEISSKDGHILAYGITEEIPRLMSALETVKMIHDQGGIAVAAHPYNLFFGVKDLVKDISFDAIEIANSSIPEKANKKAARIAAQLNIPGIAGSDSHISDTIGSGLMYFDERVNTSVQVLEAIRNNRFTYTNKHISTLPMVVKHLAKNWSLERG